MNWFKLINLLNIKKEMNFLNIRIYLKELFEYPNFQIWIYLWWTKKIFMFEYLKFGLYVLKCCVSIPRHSPLLLWSSPPQNLKHLRWLRTGSSPNYDHWSMGLGPFDHFEEHSLNACYPLSCSKLDSVCLHLGSTRSPRNIPHFFQVCSTDNFVNIRQYSNVYWYTF